MGCDAARWWASPCDAVVQIGSAYWLRVPVGNTHTDRCVPLHPQRKTLLDDWLLRRPEGLRSNLLFPDHGRPVNASRIVAAVRKTAERAGPGRVTPHQLRLALATQAINRACPWRPSPHSWDTSRCP
ncbi:tyrosine-type recombinase/integrase [Streptomyces europaeiscabiei]|uniref:tyrosine-type recombinase/integrase n=1 Tax=Streptomyces europaeiscabiei TaxID=146819 RepID=UPI0038F7F8F0